MNNATQTVGYIVTFANAIGQRRKMNIMRNSYPQVFVADNPRNQAVNVASMAMARHEPSFIIASTSVMEI